MKTIILTQKKFSVNVKETRNLTTFITEIHQMAKALKAEKDKGFKLVEVSLDALNQTINATVINNGGLPKIESESSLPETTQFEAPSLPIRPARDNNDRNRDRNHDHRR